MLSLIVAIGLLSKGGSIPKTTSQLTGKECPDSQRTGFQLSKFASKKEEEEKKNCLELKEKSNMTIIFKIFLRGQKAIK